MRKAIKKVLKHTYFQLLLRSGATTWARSRIVHAGGSLVLTFHRVLNDDALRLTNSPAGMIVRRQTFSDLVSWLGREVQFVSLHDLPTRMPRLCATITFDDGWSDNREACLELLKAQSIPACIFICSHIMDEGVPFWPERALAGLRAVRAARPVPQGLLEELARHGMDLLQVSESVLLQYLKTHPEERIKMIAAMEELFPPLQTTIDTTMTWTELRELSHNGVELGSHTAHHEMLTELPPREQIAEILCCNARMWEELQMSPRFFAYPYGSWNEEAKQSVSTCGYKRAFINVPGIWSEETDPHLIPRINLSENRLTGLRGRFSVAAAHYFLYWLPYLNRRRSQYSGHLRAATNRG